MPTSAIPPSTQMIHDTSHPNHSPVKTLKKNPNVPQIAIWKTL